MSTNKEKGLDNEISAIPNRRKVGNAEFSILAVGVGKNRIPMSDIINLTMDLNNGTVRQINKN